MPLQNPVEYYFWAVLIGMLILAYKSPPGGNP